MPASQFNQTLQTTSFQRTLVLGLTPSELALSYNGGITQEDHLYTAIGDLESAPLESKMNQFKQIFENYQSIRTFNLKKDDEDIDEPKFESINTSTNKIIETLKSVRKLSSCRSKQLYKNIEMQVKLKQLMTAKAVQNEVK
tara:strand:+ start:787 stop:1209 length:423 start_codon:yes stop_codon:yes gene_type:complete